MTELEVLRAARAKLVAGWTKGCGARDSAGNQVSITDAAACCWCLIGACYVVAGDDLELMKTSNRVVIGLAKLVPEHRLGAFNDVTGRTLEQVLALVDRGIAILEAA